MNHTRTRRDDRRSAKERAPRLITKRTFWKRARAATRRDLLTMIAELVKSPL